MEAKMDDSSALFFGLYALQYGQSEHEHSYPAHVQAIWLGFGHHRCGTIVLLLVGFYTQIVPLQIILSSAFLQESP